MLRLRSSVSLTDCDCGRAGWLTDCDMYVANLRLQLGWLADGSAEIDCDEVLATYGCHNKICKQVKIPRRSCDMYPENWTHIIAAGRDFL